MCNYLLNDINKQLFPIVCCVRRNQIRYTETRNARVLFLFFLSACFFTIRSLSCGVLRLASGYRKSRNPELARNKLSYLREKSERASRGHCVCRSGAARRSRRIKTGRRNERIAGERRIVHPPFVRSCASVFVRLPTPYCQVAQIRRLLNVSSFASTCVRDATCARAHTQTR